MVRGVLIPASDSKDPELREFDQLEDHQAAVGGWIEAVDIPDLHVTLYLNEEGLPRGLPFNRRATYFWWYHVPPVRNRARLIGDVVMVGLPDHDGESTDMPAEVETRLLTDSLHRVQLRTLGTEEWREDLSPRQPYLEAIIWASLISEISPETETRVVTGR